MHKGAILSPCRTYRYSLSRIWYPHKERIVFIGLNPSTADENVDDHTIRREINFTLYWGYGGFYKVNIFAFRSTDPKGLTSFPDPIGPDNDRHIHEICKGRKVVAAWGNGGKLFNRANIVKDNIPNLYCFGITKQGEPKHPARLRKDTQLIRLED